MFTEKYACVLLSRSWGGLQVLVFAQGWIQLISWDWVVNVPPQDPCRRWPITFSVHTGPWMLFWWNAHLPSCLCSHTAKVLRLGRLQHGQGQDEEQAASCGGARQEPGDRRPHSNAAGSAPEEVVLGDQQASRLAFVMPGAPSPPGARGKGPSSSSPVPPICPPPPLLPPLPFHPQAPLALTYRAELYKLKLHLLVCGWGGVGGADGGCGGPQGPAVSAFPPRTALPPLRTLLYRLPCLGFRCSKMHHSRCVSSGRGRMGSVNALCILYSMFLFFFCILNDTKMMCVCEGARNHDRSASFTFPFCPGGGFGGGGVGRCVWIIACIPNLLGQPPGLNELLSFHWHRVGKWWQVSGGFLTAHPSVTLPRTEPEVTCSSSAKRDLKRRLFVSLSAPIALILNSLCSCSL